MYKKEQHKRPITFHYEEHDSNNHISSYPAAQREHSEEKESSWIYPMDNTTPSTTIQHVHTRYFSCW